jgi:hypothetical protein
MCQIPSAGDTLYGLVDHTRNGTVPARVPDSSQLGGEPRSLTDATFSCLTSKAVAETDPEKFLKAVAIPSNRRDFR